MPENIKKITEQHIQALLMHYCLVRYQHKAVIPNCSTIFGWEADLTTILKSGYTNEYEIKLNIYDYNADFKKMYKHMSLQHHLDVIHRCPNYFWYVTYDFDIEPPEYAGWIRVNRELFLEKKKQAPKIHTNKIDERRRELLQVGLSYRISNLYNSIYLGRT